jgi:hypothetical protein
MTRTEALEIARANHKAHTAADIAHMFKGGPAFDAFAEYGYRHGWYTVGEYSFNMEDVTGDKYDITQAGWAFI